MKTNKAPRRHFKLKVFLISFGVVVGLGIGAGAAFNISKAKLKHIELGMSESNVLGILGDPSIVSEDKNFWYYLDKDISSTIKGLFNSDSSGKINLDEYRDKNFVSRTVQFDSNRKVESYFYNTRSKYDGNGIGRNLFAPLKDKEIKSLQNDFPNSTPCYKTNESNGVSYYAQLESHNYKYEATFSDFSICKGFVSSNELTITKSNNSTLVEGSWNYNDYLKLETELNVTLYDAYITTKASDETSRVNGGGYYNIGSTINLTGIPEEGYKANGWYKGEDKSNNPISISNDCSFKIEEYGLCNYTFFTDLVEYSITYNLNGGSNDNENPNIFTINDEVILKNASKNGYTFIGWYDSNNTKIEKIRVGTHQNIELFARYDSNSYQITLEPNGAILEETTKTVKYQEHYELPVVSLTGYKFDGWFYNDDFIQSNGTWDIDHDVTLTARWTIIVYSITYNLDGGVNNSNNPSKYTINDSITFQNPTKEGYKFLGWYDDTNVQVLGIDVGTIGNIVLTAHWQEAGNYQVTLDPNGGNVSQNKVNVTFNEYYSLPTPTNDGYTFDGWFTSENVQINSTGTWLIRDNLTLYAHWTAIEYSITYMLSSGINNPLNPSTYTIEDEVTLYDANLAGYTFLGWYNSNNEKVTSISLGSTGDITLTGVWNDGNSYTITFDSDGGVLSETHLLVQYNHEYILPTPTKVGYQFTGWYNGYNQIANTGTWTITSDITLIAHWQIIQYTVTYELDGGVLASPNPSSYNINSNATLNNPTKSGYTFIGWFDQNDTKISILTTGFVGNLVLTARYSEGETFVVTLDPNGGEVSPTQVNVVSGHAYSLPTPSKNGYTFAGWFDNETLVSNEGSWTELENKTLLAHWSATVYTISYNLDGGTLSTANPSTYTIEDAFSFNEPTKDGYTFAGWFVDDTQKTGIQLGETGNLNLTARWTPLLHTLSVLTSDSTKGTVSIIEGEGYTGENIELLATPYGSNVFMGWYNQDDVKVSGLSSYTFKMPNKDLILTGVFMSVDESLGIDPVIDMINMTITYGLYPQTKVERKAYPDLISNGQDERGWYYSDNKYFVKHRETAYGLGVKYDDGERIYEPPGVTSYNYFLCEPIKWDIIYTSGGEYLLNSSKILDTYFWNYTGDSSITYQFCLVRTFLTGTFFNNAFKDSSVHLRTTYNFLTDKVSLLEKDDYQNELYGYTDDNSRKCRTTDYARVSGVKVNQYFNGLYLTRTKYSSQNSWIFVVGESGAIGPDASYPYIHNASGDLWSCPSGIRPSITFSL